MTLPTLSEPAQEITSGSIYEHYKGLLYQIISIARHSETLEELIVYKALYDDGDVWVRPLEMFLETVKINEEETPRFKKVKSAAE